MIARFDKFKRFETPLLTVCNPGSYVTSDNLLTNSVCALPYAKDIDATLNFGSLSELAFTLPLIDEKVRDTYSDLETGRYIYASDIGYFIIDSVEDSFSQEGRVKEISCVSVERELEELEAPFYKAGVYPLISNDTKDGVLTLAMAKCPSWSLDHIDDKVKARSRYFEIAESTSIYEFFMNDLQDKFDCVFCYDIINRKISVYDRAAYADQHLTSIHLARNNIIEGLDISQDYDDLYTALSVTGDENMSIRRVNPIGTTVIYDFTYHKHWMSPELQDAVTRWEAKIASVEESYVALNREYYNQYLAMSETQMDIDKLNTQIDIYYTCRDCILSGTISSKKTSLLSQLKKSGAVGDDATTDAVPVALATVNTKITELSIAKAQKQTLYNSQKSQADATKAQIDAIQAACSLSTTARDVNGKVIFTDELLRELSAYIKQADYTDDNITKTDIMSQDEIFDWCVELMKRAKTQLSKISTPNRKFEVTTRSFIFSQQFASFTSQLESGCIVTAEVDDDQFEQLHLLTIDIDFESKTISLTFGNKYNQYDPRSLFDDVFGDVSKSKATLQYVTGIVEDMSKQVNDASKWIDEALILTKDKALSAKNQEVIIDDGGYLGRLRKTQKDAHGMDALDADGNPIFLTDSQGNPIYDGEQLRIVNNCIVFTDDGWETAKTAVGKLYLGKDKSGNDVYKYGVAGDVIIGKIIAGNNLIIAGGSEENGDYSVTIDDKGLTINNGDILIKDPNGKKVFGVEDGQMYLDGSIVATGSLSIDSIAVGDYTNYVNLSEETADVYGFKSAAEYAAETAHKPYINERWLTPISYPTVSPYFIYISKSYPCKIGDSFRITGDVYSRAYHNNSLDVKIALVVTVRNAQGVESKKNIYSDKVPFSNGGYTTLNNTVTIDTKSLESTSLTPVNFSIAIATFVKDTSTKTNVTAGWYAVNNLEVRRASAGEITAGLLKSKDGETYINLDTGDAQLTGTVRVKGANYDVWLKSKTADGETEAGLYLTKTDGSDTNGRVVLYEDTSGDTCVAIAGETIVIGATSSDSNFANNLSLQSTGYLGMSAINDIQILSNGFAATINGKTTMKGGNIEIHGGTGFNLTVPSYYSDEPTSVRLTNYIRKAVGPLNDGWEIQPYITTGSLTATYGITIGGINYTGDYSVLWPTGNNAGMFMNKDQTIELTKNISDLPNGIVLVWSVYSGGSQNYGFNYVFVPKYHVENWNGFAPSMLLSSEDGNYVAWKYLYISDNKISGYKKNGSGEYTASSGIKFTPNHFVLRAVIGI